MKNAFERTRLQEEAKALGMELTQEQISQFEIYAGMLSEWNSRINITRVPENKYVERHFIDSLLAAKGAVFLGSPRVVDIGTGGGFPGLPLKIAYPDIRLTLVDSSNKKLQFLRAVIEELGFNNVEAIHGRAEDLGKDGRYRESFSIATARAVAELRILAELTLPVVRCGGIAVLMKGEEASVELKGAEAAIRILGGGEARVERCSELSWLVCIRKERPTPHEYPRNSKKVYSKPL